MKKLIGIALYLLVVVFVVPSPALADEMPTQAVQVININSADAAMLSELKGIGETKAQAIIAWRDKNGPFESVDQLLAVNGIGDATLEAIRDQITLE